MLDFDATDLRRQPPVDTTWQQVCFCLHTYNIERTLYSTSIFLSFNGMLNPTIELVSLAATAA